MQNGLQRKEEEGKNRIRFRAILLGFVMAVAICALTPFNNIYRYAMPLGGGHFPMAPFFILVWLTVLVAVLRKIFKGYSWLTGKELMLTWVLMVLVSGIASTGLARTFFVNLTAPYHFATVENHWQEVLHPLLPRPWYPQSPDAVKGIYNGLSNGRQMGWFAILTRIPWKAWLQPLLIWSAFVLLCYFVMICVINLFSRQWIDNERMNFPLLQVPQLIEDALDDEGLSSLLTHRFLIAGIMVPVFLHLFNGLHFYYPDVPEIPTLVLAGPYFPKHGLFSGFQKLKIYIYPAFIGFAFLTSKQVSFSFWCFFLLGGLLIGLLSILGYNIPAAALGVMFGPNLSRPEEMQMIGAYGVFFLFLLWLARHHLLQVVRHSLGSENDLAGEKGWLSIRFSFWGAVIGLSAIIAWCHYFGLPLLVAVLLVGAFFMVMFVASRVVCQGGVAYFTLTAAPTDGLLAFFGPKFFTGLGALVAGVVQKVLFVDLRASLMPSLLHARKITQKMAGQRMIFISILLTLLAGVIVSFLAMLTLCYKFGMRELRLEWATRTTVAVYETIYSLIESPVGSSNWVLLFIMAGAIVMLAMVTCYHRWYWWPIHPIGYLTAYSSAMRTLWFSFFLGWIFNALCMRYGGVVLFKQLRFFFVGFIVGDFLMGGAWALVGIFADASYLVLPR